MKSRDGVVTAVAKWWPWPPSTSISSFLTDLSPSRLAAHNRLSYQLDSIHHPMLPFQSSQRNCARPILIESEPTPSSTSPYQLGQRSTTQISLRALKRRYIACHLTLVDTPSALLTIRRGYKYHSNLKDRGRRSYRGTHVPASWFRTSRWGRCSNDFCWFYIQWKKLVVLQSGRSCPSLRCYVAIFSCDSVCIDLH